jgi:hypothetical protein
VTIELIPLPPVVAVARGGFVAVAVARGGLVAVGVAPGREVAVAVGVEPLQLPV